MQLYKEGLQKKTIGISQRGQKSHNPLTKLHKVDQTRNGVGNMKEHQAWKRPPFTTRAHFKMEVASTLCRVIKTLCL
jgi:hypothetical protein